MKRYRPCVGIALFNCEGMVFAGQRWDSSVEAWQMPQGGIDFGEEPMQALWRELREETGLTTARFIGQVPGTYRYDLPADLQGKLWGGGFFGQEQQWFALYHDGPDSAINIATPEPEFKAWKWVRLSDLARLIVPFKRALYAKLEPQLAQLWACYIREKDAC